LSQILMAALESFDLKTSVEPKTCRSPFPYTNYHPTQKRNGKDEKPPAITGQCLVQILQQSAILSLGSHAVMFLERVHELGMTAPTTVFYKVMVPYMASVLTHLEETDSLPILGHDCGHHIFQILQLYMIRYVKKEPQRAPSWARSVTFITCACKDCIDMKASANDPERTEGPFRMAEKRRGHLEHHLYNQEGYTTETVRQGSPHTLVITRINAVYRREHAEWQSRYGCAKDHVTDLARNPCLKKLLGDKYADIFELKVTDQSAWRTALRPPLRARQNPSAAAQKSSKKRKSDGADSEPVPENKKPKPEDQVVDLTSEEIESG
jgi:hypothetical protein